MAKPARSELKQFSSPPKKALKGKSEQPDGKSGLANLETPYLPDLNAHAEMLAGASSSIQRADLVTQLQQTYGNRYVQRLLKPGNLSRIGSGSLQRAPTGLATSMNTMAVANVAYQFWKNDSNKDKPLKDLSDALMERLNTKLPYPIPATYVNSGDTGAFNRVDWTIEMNTSAFSSRSITKVGDLNQAEVSDIVDTIYHESRHAEQSFSVAQMKAQQGKTAQEIVTEMSIPALVAQAAVAAPKEGTTETRGWEAFMVGKYEKYKGEVAELRDEISAMTDKLEKCDTHTKLAGATAKVTAIKTHLDDFFTEEKEKIEELSNKESFDESVLLNITNIEVAFNSFKTEFDIQKGDATKYNLAKLTGLGFKLYEARYNAYRDYAHEKDAWSVGGKAGTAFKDRAQITI